MKQDNVWLFGNEECDFNETASIRASDLYNAYLTWSAKQKLQSVSKHRFYKQIQAKFPNVTPRRNRGTNIIKFYGIGLIKK